MHRSLWLAIAVSLIITSIPSVSGMMFPPPGGSWTGILSRNTADVNGYLSMIEEARQGHWRMRNLFTAEPHNPFQIRPLWLLLGFIGIVVPSISNVQLMEGARLISVFCLLLIIATFAVKLFENSRDRLISFLVMAFGSGIGWAHLVSDPPDLRIVETSTFLTLISPPLYSVSLSLVLTILLLVEKCWNSEKSFRWGILAGLCALWLGFDRPFSLGPLAFAVAGFLLVQSINAKKIPVRKVVTLLPLLVGALIPASYHYFAIQTVPVYSEWNRQHVLRTPEWIRLISSLGLLIPLAVAGFRSAFQKNTTLAILASFFLMGSLLFSHLPLGFQERFLEGLPILTSMFASFGLIRFLRRFQSPALQTLFATILLVVLAYSHLIPLQNDLAAIARQSPPQYMPDKVLGAMRRVKRLSADNEAIFSTEPTGNFLIAYAGRPVVIAQRIQTARYMEKAQLVARYFATQGNQPLSRELFLISRAKWLFWGPEEAWTSRGRFHPSQASYLEEKYNDGFIRIFKLK